MTKLTSNLHLMQKPVANIGGLIGLFIRTSVMTIVKVFEIQLHLVLSIIVNCPTKGYHVRFANTYYAKH